MRDKCRRRKLLDPSMAGGSGENMKKRGCGVTVYRRTCIVLDRGRGGVVGTWWILGDFVHVVAGRHNVTNGGYDGTGLTEKYLK